MVKPLSSRLEALGLNPSIAMSAIMGKTFCFCSVCHATLKVSTK